MIFINLFFLFFFFAISKNIDHENFLCDTRTEANKRVLLSFRMFWEIQSIKILKVSLKIIYNIWINVDIDC